MKLLKSLLIVFAFAAVAASQTPQPSSDRMFFPKDAFWGWAQFDLAPPHNEIDPNLCASNAGTFGGASAPCNLFGRYMISGTLEVRPFGQGILRRFMLFGSPSLLLGKNVPQKLYTWSPDVIGVEHSWGASIFSGTDSSCASPSISCSTVSVRAIRTLAPLILAITAHGGATTPWAFARPGARSAGRAMVYSGTAEY